MLLEPTLAVWKWNQAQCLSACWFLMTSGSLRWKQWLPLGLSALREKKKEIKILQIKLQAALHVAFLENCNHRMHCIGEKTIITGQFYAIFMCALVFLCFFVCVCFNAYYGITHLTYFNGNINSIRIKHDPEFPVRFTWKLLYWLCRIRNLKTFSVALVTSTIIYRVL